MKSNTPTITLLGNNSGRNLGDAAILSAILDVVSKEIPDAEFLVPSTHPHFIDDNYGSTYNVKGVNVMPWTGSIRLLGIPTFRCIAKSDIALICDGIIFGKKLWNPAFNFLITLIFLMPWAKLTGCKVVCYSCGIGPFPSFWSRLFAKWVINGSDLVIMRERDSEALSRKIGVTKPIEVTGDAAFINPVSSDERAEQILEEEGISSELPLLGINVTTYIDSWLSADERVGSKEKFLEMLAEGINQAKEQVNERFTPLLFSTQPMDEKVTYKVAEMVGAKVIHNSKYLSHDIQAAMRRCGLLIGMRFHSLVLSSAVGVPIVGLVYAPKVRGYMRLLDCEDYSLELKDMSAENFRDTVVKAWNKRAQLRTHQSTIVEDLKRGAQRAAVTLRERYFTATENDASPAAVNS